MLTAPLKICIVGCGRIADDHVEQIRALPHLASLTAVCDRELLMAEQLAVRYGVARLYDDFESMLARERPDVVHIATPPQTHIELATRSLAAGCHVYVEKPLAPRYQDALDLVHHAERLGLSLTVGYTFFFDPASLVMRELIEQGVLGELVHVDSVFGYDLQGPFGRAVVADRDHWVHKLPGKLLHNTIDHLLNKLVELVDSSQPTVIALGKRRDPRRFGDHRDELVDELRVMLSGDRVTAHAMFSGHARPASQLCRIYGTRNVMDVDYLARTVTLRASAPLPSAIGRLLPAFSQAASLAREGTRNMIRFASSDFHFFAGLRELMDRFYRSILEGGPAPITHRDILWVSWVMEQIFAQLHPEAYAPSPLGSTPAASSQEP